MGFSYGTRARLQSLAESDTLIWVRLSNQSFKAGAFDAGGVMLVADQRTQYDLVGTVDLGEGEITQKLAPLPGRPFFLHSRKQPESQANSGWSRSRLAMVLWPTRDDLQVISGCPHGQLGMVLWPTRDDLVVSSKHLQSSLRQPRSAIGLR